MLKDKVLIGVGTRNMHYFLSHFIRTFERHDPGYSFDLLIIDESSTDKKHLKLLDQLSKKYKIDVRPSTGRGEGTLEYLRKNYRNQYEYYFHMHGDSAILRSGWLDLIVKRMNDNYKETRIDNYPEIANLPIGKVGFSGDMYNSLDYYLTPRKELMVPAPQPYAKQLFSYMNIEIPRIWQIIEDERVLWKNDLFSKVELFWNIEEFRKRRDTEMFKKINDFWGDFYRKGNDERAKPENMWVEPKEIYNGANWYGFQGVSEMFACFAPYIYGYRTHNIYGDGFLQSVLGWSQFWGLEYINHYGNHTFFKRMCKLYKLSENEFRSKLDNEVMLITCDKIVKKQTEEIIRCGLDAANEAIVFMCDVALKRLIECGRTCKQ